MAGLLGLILLAMIGYALLKTAEGVRTVVKRRVLGPETAHPDDIAALRREVAALREEVAYLRGVTLGARASLHDTHAACGPHSS